MRQDATEAQQETYEGLGLGGYQRRQRDIEQLKIYFRYRQDC